MSGWLRAFIHAPILFARAAVDVLMPKPTTAAHPRNENTKQAVVRNCRFHSIHHPPFSLLLLVGLVKQCNQTRVHLASSRIVCRQAVPDPESLIHSLSLSLSLAHTRIMEAAT